MTWMIWVWPFFWDHLLTASKSAVSSIHELPAAVAKTHSMLRLLGSIQWRQKQRVPSWTTGASLAASSVQPKTSPGPPPRLLTWPVSSLADLLVCFTGWWLHILSSAQSPALHPQMVTTQTSTVLLFLILVLRVLFVGFLTDGSHCLSGACLQLLSTAWLDATQGSFSLVWCFVLVFIGEFGAQAFHSHFLKSASSVVRR